MQRLCPQHPPRSFQVPVSPRDLMWDLLAPPQPWVPTGGPQRSIKAKHKMRWSTFARPAQPMPALCALSSAAARGQPVLGTKGTPAVPVGPLQAQGHPHPAPPPAPANGAEPGRGCRQRHGEVLRAELSPAPQGRLCHPFRHTGDMAGAACPLSWLTLPAPGCVGAWPGVLQPQGQEPRELPTTPGPELCSGASTCPSPFSTAPSGSET